MPDPACLGSCIRMRTKHSQFHLAETDLEESPSLASIESVAMNDAAIRTDWVGRTVDLRFALLEWLGGSPKRGVFLTVRQGLQRAVIKLTVATGADTDACLTQWEAAKGLSHPHLMPIFETGRYTIDGTETVYIVTEHADDDLAQIVSDRALDAHAAREMLNPVLDALSYLHEKGFVHGHIKPSNIFRVEGVVMLSTDEFLVAGGVAKPSPMRGIYDAPETTAANITPASDVWSLGMMLAETLTQQLPFADPETGAEPVLPDSLPQPFRGLIQECLRIDPAARCTINDFRSQLAFASALLATASPVPKATPSVPAASEPPPVDPIPAIPEPNLFAEPYDLSIDPDLEADSFQPPAASILFGVPDNEEPSRSGFPFLPILLGLVVLAAFVAILLVRSNRLKLSWPFIPQNPVASSQPAPQTKPETPTTSDTQSEAPTATPQPQSPQPAAPQSPAADQGTAQTQPQAVPAPESTSPPASIPVVPPKEQEPVRPSNMEGTVAYRVMPNVSPSARVSMHGPVQVTIRVTVDRSGKVEDASYVSPGPGNYFARISQRAASSWKFDPPRREGRSEPSVWLLRFYFSRRDTEVSAIEESR
jgi:serine/threonine protein kinase